MSSLEGLIEESRRQLTICDSCRYCEGYCPTFPALDRGGLTDGDVVFLANVCHDCQGCLQACMYAPPHEFAVDIPAALTAVRESGYSEMAWPTCSPARLSIRSSRRSSRSHWVSCSRSAPRSFTGLISLPHIQAREVFTS